MKRVYKYCIVIVVLCCLVGTITFNLREKEKNKKIGIVENPSFSSEDYWGNEMFPDIPFDKCSENISVSIENEKILLSEKSINISLSSEKSGTGFYFYGIPAIEKRDENKWERLSYKESDPSREQWCVCAIEDAEGICFSTDISVDIDNINDFTEGSYRAVVFLTDRNIYVPFEVIGDK